MITAVQNKNVIVTNDGKCYEKPSTGTSVGAYMVGSTASVAAQYPITALTGRIFSSGTEKVVKDFGRGGKYAAETPVIRKAAKDAFTKSGLANFGVEVLDATAENKNAIIEYMEQGLPKWMQKISKNFPNIPILAKAQILAQAENAEKGLNAFYAFEPKKVVFSMENNPLLAFHEMGHGLNFNTKGVGKILSTIRNPMMKLSGLVLLVALCKRKKMEGEEPKGMFDKVTTFVKNNCGKLAFMCALPTVFEEALATAKGLKLAKGAGASEQMLKQIKVLNAKGLLTYIGVAVAMGVGTAVASKIRDMIAKPKEIAS